MIKRPRIMDETERPIPENQPLNIYDARLTFRKIGKYQLFVSVKIRYGKKGPTIEKKFSEEDFRNLFPEGINYEDLLLGGTRYHGEEIYVYHRVRTDEYIDMRHYHVPTSLGQKLEKLVSKTISGN